MESFDDLAMWVIGTAVVLVLAFIGGMVTAAFEEKGKKK